jgi:hypothetical protein
MAGVSSAPSRATRGPAAGVDDDVTRLQADVLVLVAVDDEVVEVQLGDDLAVTAQLDLAHAAVLAPGRRWRRRR